MIVKKMKYIFLLIFTLQNYNFCCEECCDYCEECWNNCWKNSTTDQNSSLQGGNSINNNSKKGKEIIDKNFKLNKIKPNNNDGSCWRKGLANIGATCYMNATLQCFAHIPEFVTFFRKEKQVQDIIKNYQNMEQYNLTGAFAELLQNLYPTNLENMKNKTYYEPNNFKNTISQMDPLFKGIAANDAKDLVNFLIMTLHGELNKVPQNQKNNNNDNLLPNQTTNKQFMFNSFTKKFKNENDSIISNLFYALNCSITKCINCNVTSYNYQIYFFLIFPLEEVRKFKLTSNNGFNNNGLNNNFNNNDTVDIYDCFNFDNRINIMQGDNAMYCPFCQLTCGSSMRTILATGPNILIIILNRGKGKEFDVKLNFSEQLNLCNYIELKDAGTQYELFGVITHIGESGMSGHFIAYCKDLWENNWYKYNDAIVSKVENFKTEVVDFAMPYLLFYKLKKNNMSQNNNNNNMFYNFNNIIQNNNNNMLINNNMINPPFNYMNPNNNMFFPNNNMFFPNQFKQ